MERGERGGIECGLRKRQEINEFRHDESALEVDRLQYARCREDRASLTVSPSRRTTPSGRGSLDGRHLAGARPFPVRHVSDTCTDRGGTLGWIIAGRDTVRPRPSRTGSAMQRTTIRRRPTGFRRVVAHQPSP
ncbi:hypothetical protein GCM10009624_01820 [Gordonia sinesedis]